MNQDTLKFANLPPPPTLRVREEGFGFSCDLRCLVRMGRAEDGIRDALTRYTTAGSGAYYARPLGGSAAPVCLRGRLRSML